MTHQAPGRFRRSLGRPLEKSRFSKRGPEGEMESAGHAVAAKTEPKRCQNDSKKPPRPKRADIESDRYLLHFRDIGPPGADPKWRPLRHRRAEREKTRFFGAPGRQSWPKWLQPGPQKRPKSREMPTKCDPGAHPITVFLPHATKTSKKSLFRSFWGAPGKRK